MAAHRHISPLNVRAKSKTSSCSFKIASTKLSSSLKLNRFASATMASASERGEREDRTGETWGELTVVLNLENAKKLSVVLNLENAIETFSRIDILQRHRNFQSYWHTKSVSEYSSVSFVIVFSASLILCTVLNKATISSRFKAFIKMWWSSVRRSLSAAPIPRMETLEKYTRFECGRC